MRFHLAGGSAGVNFYLRWRMWLVAQRWIYNDRVHNSVTAESFLHRKGSQYALCWK